MARICRPDRAPIGIHFSHLVSLKLPYNSHLSTTARVVCLIERPCQGGSTVSVKNEYPGSALAWEIYRLRSRLVLTQLSNHVGPISRLLGPFSSCLMNSQLRLSYYCFNLSQGSYRVSKHISQSKENRNSVMTEEQASCSVSYHVVQKKLEPHVTIVLVTKMWSHNGMLRGSQIRK